MAARIAAALLLAGGVLGVALAGPASASQECSPAYCPPPGCSGGLRIDPTREPYVWFEQYVC